MDLFTPLEIRSVTLRNRIVVSPMCQYSCDNGMPTDWHLVHLGSRAVGGAALVIVEATAVEARGRISPGDLGIWSDAHRDALAPIVRFMKSQGAVAGIQLAHAGRKASCFVPWENKGAQLTKEQGGWDTVAPSPLPFAEADRPPAELTTQEIQSLVRAFGEAARRSFQAGFEVIEIHGAHGYLINEFLSPLSNHRADEYGGSFDNRARFLLEVIAGIRAEWPSHLPLFLRLSATDWVEGGWTVQDSAHLATIVKPLGVDLIDCSSGALVPYAKIPVGPGYQVPLADHVKREGHILAGAVGMITEPEQANEIITSGKADLVFLARQFLRDPYWPFHAAKVLKATLPPPVQYGRAL